MVIYLVYIFVLIFFNTSIFATTPTYKFDLVARENFSLFDDIDNKSTANSKKNTDEKIIIKWVDDDTEPSSSSEDAKNNDNNKGINISWKTEENTYSDDDSSSLVDWFSSYEEPEIFKKREVKTSFRKNDPFYGKHLCGNGTYTCIQLKKGDSWQTLFPDKYQRELVQRINRTNKGLWNRSWVLVPNDINSDYMDFSPLPDYWDTNGKKTIVVDISELAFAAYDQDGDIVHWGPVNPGKDSTQTARGENFKVYRKGGPECWSKKYESYIPYCMFFHKGFALHGYSMPGYAASHGCVRTYVDDALWLNKNFADYNTRVIVQD